MNTFIKAQINSVVSTLADFALTILLKQVLGVWYLAASAAGALCGGMVNFILGRYWVFPPAEKPLVQQALRYAGVWAGSLLLNTILLYLLTDVAGMYYLLSKTIITITVAIGYNFLMQKYFVFSR